MTLFIGNLNVPFSFDFYKAQIRKIITDAISNYLSLL